MKARIQLSTAFLMALLLSTLNPSIFAQPEGGGSPGNRFASGRRPLNVDSGGFPPPRMVLTLETLSKDQRSKIEKILEKSGFNADKQKLVETARSHGFPHNHRPGVRNSSPDSSAGQNDMERTPQNARDRFRQRMRESGGSDIRSRQDSGPIEGFRPGGGFRPGEGFRPGPNGPMSPQNEARNDLATGILGGISGVDGDTSSFSRHPDRAEFQELRSSMMSKWQKSWPEVQSILTDEQKKALEQKLQQGPQRQPMQGMRDREAGQFRQHNRQYNRREN